MRGTMSDEEVMALAEGEATDRAHLDATAVRKHTQSVLSEIESLLERAYNLTYLEAKLHCDAYHEGKNSFSDLGESYGYINSFVRRDGGTNCMRFAYRRPTGSGHLIRENIRMSSQGYTEASFKRAAHEYEKELAVMTEEHYSRLRNQGKTLKSVARKIRSIEIFTGGDNQDNE
ncbi:MAG: conjugative transfer protein MobI(A/C) [Candidatus Thiodiazotropha endolucinida]|nr:hypothetical protein [Candidatus Thiodiazotropha endolucinida]